MSTVDNYIVERELQRRELYERNIIDWLTDVITKFKPHDNKSNYKIKKEISHIAIRYILNKIITRTLEDDPVFITSKSEIAEHQFVLDLLYYGIEGDHKKLVYEFEANLSKCSDELKKISLSEDETPLYIPHNTQNTRKNTYGAWKSKRFNEGEDGKFNEGEIQYNCQRYADIANLGKRNPTKLRHALALGIRYNYLNIGNHNLARTFEKDGFKRNEATEGFASAFNHYFDSFCSAFPDLEYEFGSMGSFFDVISRINQPSTHALDFKTQLVFVNPPFDESLMSHAMKKVYEYIQTSNTKRKFIFTIPDWTDWSALNELKKSEYVEKVTIHKKGTLDFINYMDRGNIVRPCDIAEITTK